MGDSKSEQTTSSTQSQTVTPQATAEEKRLNELNLELREAVQPGLIGTQTAGLDLISSLLSGGTIADPFQSLITGIDPAVTDDIVQQSLADITPGFQSSGLLDSGVRAEISGRLAGDIRRQAEESNLNRVQNLLSQALGGQAQIQQPILGFGQQLGQSLAGLRPVTSTGTSTGTATTSNPFLNTGFASGLGQGLGSGAGGFIFGS